MRVFRIPATLIIEIPDLTVTLSVLREGVVLIAFSEAVGVSFVLTNITVTNGTASNLRGDGRNFTIDVAAADDSGMSIHIGAGVASTEDGRTNLESNRLVI